MKRENLISRIIPTIIRNTDENQKMGNGEFDTEDLIYLESFYERKEENSYKNITYTDYAKMNSAHIHKENKHSSENTTKVYFRSAFNRFRIHYINNNGKWSHENTSNTEIGLCPALHYKLPADESEEIDIREVKDKDGKRLYNVLLIGEYLKDEVNEDLRQTLEAMYNNGKIHEGIIPTGRWYSSNGQNEKNKCYAGKHNPEFEYQENRYARVVIKQNNNYTIKWIKVEPINFIIKNWEEMPKSINLEGNGKAKYFDLISEKAIISNIPFYPDQNDENSSMWQNSTARGFLNGIDVRNITENGNVEYRATKGGNFTGECNFLNEAFNLTRQPIIEYEIPQSETYIPDDAFNGCISLKKLTIHSEIKNVGQRSFDGLNFKYAYITEIGDIVFSQELPKDKEECKKIFELWKITKSLVGFDYSILVKNKNIDNIIKFSEMLSKKKISIPYVYGLQLIKYEKTQEFCKNSDFRFFKNELPNINDMLKNFSEEEKLDFFRFANVIGCFSAKKMLDEKRERDRNNYGSKGIFVSCGIIKNRGDEITENIMDYSILY